MESAPSVLVVSASDSDDDVRRMLSNGAVGFVRKPGTTASVTPQAFHQELRTSLAQLMAPGRPRSGPAPVVAAPPQAAPFQAPTAPFHAPAATSGGDVVELGGLPRARVELVVIGASTGGPDALHHFFSHLPPTYRVPTVVVQHMPPVFTAQFAKRLDAVSHLSVREAQGGEALEEGCVYLAPGGKHLVVAKRLAQPLGTVAIYDGPHENSCKPAVDPLFRTAAECYGSGVVGVVFTGMGSDGQLGCRALQAAGGWVMVQDQPTSVVWGMPGYVARDGAANRILPLERMAPELARIVAR
jgi:two-component system chemotaxis response regulator CheB